MSILSKPIRVGRYVLCDKIASGGMASVYFGRLEGASGFAKTVAIKRLHPELARMPDFRTMILEEGKIAARIRHPNVVPPLDVLAESRELLLVMEYVHGESFSKLMKAAWAAGERVPLAVAAAILSNVFHGLHAAHEAKDESGAPLGIVHRDVSPQNVIVGVDGIARVIDFGIAKAVTSTTEATSAGTVKGKVPYLAPEQLEGDPATRRTDVYAASVVMWEALAGRRLFDGRDDAEILRQIMAMPIAPPSAFNATVPCAIDDVVLRGLARAPAQRFPTAREMALAIETTVHLATATQVGAWTERLAADALDDRAKKLADVEGLGLDAPTETFSRNRSAHDLSPVSISMPSPLERTPARPVTAPFASPAPFAPSAPAAPFAPPPFVPSAPAPLPSGELRKPELEPPNGAWLPHAPPAEAARMPRGRKIAYGVFGGLALAVVVLVLYSPFLAQRTAVSRAEDVGVTLKVDRVDVSRHELRFVDVRASSAEIPGVSVHASAVDVGLRGLTPTSIVVEEMQISVEGALADVVSRVERWRATHAARLHEQAAGLVQISITSAKLEWKDVAGPGTSATAENASFDMDKLGTRAFGDDWKLESPILTFTAGRVTAGPWKLDVGRQGILTTAVVRFDPTGTYPSNVSWTEADDGSVTTAFAVPSTPLAELHAPKELFGGFATDKTRLEARGEITVVTSSQSGAAAKVGRAATGHVALSATDAALLAGAPPVDAHLEVPVAGDVSTPIAVPVATLTLAPADPSGPAVASAKLAGHVDLTGRLPRLELEGKTTPLSCGKAGESVTYATTLAFALDRLGGTRVSFEPSRACTPKLR